MEAPDGVVVAVRTRRAWTDSIGPWLADREHDLGDCWQQTALQRRGLTLDLITPIDFGQGDPFADGIGGALVARLEKATDGAIRLVAWRFAGPRPKPPRRAASSDLDVYHPGDPVGGVLADVAEQIGSRLRLGESPPAGEVLGRLSVAAVSQHRVWFAAPDPGVKAAVAATPGAAFALRDAVRRWQGKEPLYCIVVDGWVAQASPRLRKTA